MTTPLDPKQIVPFEEPQVSGSPAGSPYQVARGEGDIHQRRVLGDGEGDKSGDDASPRLEPKVNLRE